MCLHAIEIYGKLSQKRENNGCTENCIKLRINAGDKTLQTHKIRLLQMRTETNS